MNQDETWHRGIELGPGHIVLDGYQAPPKEHSPQFSAHVCYGQTAGWIKMPQHAAENSILQQYKNVR